MWKWWCVGWRMSVVTYFTCLFVCACRYITISFSWLRNFRMCDTYMALSLFLSLRCSCASITLYRIVCWLLVLCACACVCVCVCLCEYCCKSCTVWIFIYKFVSGFIIYFWCGRAIALSFYFLAELFELFHYLPIELHRASELLERQNPLCLLTIHTHAERTFTIHNTIWIMILLLLFFFASYLIPFGFN